MRRSASVLGIALASSLLLAACGAEEGIPEGGTDRGQDEEETPNPTEPPAIDAGSEPQPFDCFDVSPMSPGVYQVADAGTVEVAVDDGDYTVASVETADGWQHEVEEDGGLRVEVRFRPTGDDTEGDPRDDDDFADASDPQEHIADSDDQEILILVVSQGPSADHVDADAEVCTSLN